LTIDGSLQKPGAISPLSIASDVDGQKVTALLTEAYEGKASQVIRRLTATKHGKFLVSDVVKLLDVNSVVTWRMNYCRQTSTYVANTSPSVAPCFDPGSTRPTLRVELLPDQRGVRITEDQLDAKSCSPRYMDIETEVGSGLVVSVVSAEVGNSDCKAVLIRSPANSGVQRIINVTMTPKTGNPVWP
jgi:hypothetical protein